MAWFMVAALGAYHGLNPAMGWLFAVALGQQERRSAAVLRALPPIAAGHLLSVAGVVVAAGIANQVLSPESVRFLGAVCLVGFAIWLIARRSRHPGWVGMRLGATDLVLWSLIMTTAHGAGLMLLPALLPAEVSSVAHSSGHHHSLAGPVPPLLVLAIHTGAMFAAMAAAALAAHRLLGLGFLRRRWINLDVVWIGAMLVAAGALVLG
jgi:hypothetical protein